jgi:predicted RNase H-like HicB family nuclease
MSETYTFPLGLEEGPDGAIRVHALSLPGCTSEGATRDEALAAFPAALADWFALLAEVGERTPEPEAELDLAIDEWVETDADVAAGETNVCYEADLAPLESFEIDLLLRRLGDLRGRLLRTVRQIPDAELDAIELPGGYTLRRALDELARAQWWTLSRLGASPMAEIPERTLGRLDTAMALVLQCFTEMPAEQRAAPLEIEGELWSPRKVLRRLLELEWAVGRMLHNPRGRRFGERP